MPLYGNIITGNANIRKYLIDGKYELKFYEHQLSRAVKLKVAHSSLNDRGNGWKSWRLYDENNDKIGDITQYGY